MRHGSENVLHINGLFGILIPLPSERRDPADRRKARAQRPRRSPKAFVTWLTEVTESVDGSFFLAVLADLDLAFVKRPFGGFAELILRRDGWDNERTMSIKPNETIFAAYGRTIAPSLGK
jgi:hypothetical protein